MAAGASKVPAWRRLGLTLKNENHSGVAVAEPTPATTDLQPAAPYDGLESSHGDAHFQHSPTVKGKSSKLGKRKHQHDPAEQHNPLAKRGKRVGEELVSAESAVAAVTPVAEPVKSSDDDFGVVPESEVKQPKGDPNYRKKKEKKPRRKREDRESGGQVKQDQDHSPLSPSTAGPSKQPALVASTEIKETSFATPQKPRRGDSKDSSSSPSGTERRKSVAFTPDTKKVDGSSAQNLFKKWVAEQKGLSGEEPSFQVTEPQAQQPNLSIEDKVNRTSEDTREEKTESAADILGKAPIDKTPVSTPTGKKKDPSLYTSYLIQYHEDRDNWKFNKAKQNDVINNALNVFRIPQDFSSALLEYVQGLKGVGVVDRLKANCEEALKELDKEDAENPLSMDDLAVRQAARDEALERRVKQEKKRRKTDGDIETLSQHPHGEGFIRRLKRERAEALLSALGRAAPILPIVPAAPQHQLQDYRPVVRDSKKRKRRVEISSDESSSESSSDEEDDSSSDSDSDSADSDNSENLDSDSEVEGPNHHPGTHGDPDSKSSSDEDSSDDEDRSDSGSGSGSGDSEDSDADSDSDSD